MWPVDLYQTVQRSFFFSQLFLFPGSRTPSRDFYFMYDICQDAGIRTRAAATAAMWATNELHTSLKDQDQESAYCTPCIWIFKEK